MQRRYFQDCNRLAESVAAEDEQQSTVQFHLLIKNPELLKFRMTSKSLLHHTCTYKSGL